MKLLGLDFETTGLDPKKDLVTEVGLVLWDTDRRAPLLIDSFYVFWEQFDTMTFDPEVVAKTGITVSDCRQFGENPLTAYRRLMGYHHMIDAVVAHNGLAFDKLFADEWAARLDQLPISRTWIDTTIDLDFGPEITTRKLSYLAAEHGFLNPFAHRAVFDVLTMMRILDQYSAEKALESARQPIISLQALVSFDERQLAKDHGFRWEPTSKRWLRSVRRHKAKEFPFQTKEVNL